MEEEEVDDQRHHQACVELVYIVHHRINNLSEKKPRCLLRLVSRCVVYQTSRLRRPLNGTPNGRVALLKDLEVSAEVRHFSGPCPEKWATKKAQIPVVKEEQPAREEEGEKFMKGRSVIAEVVIDQVFMAEHQLVEVNDLLIAKSWDHLFREEILVDESIVREFYSEFNLEKKSGLLLASFVINGEAQAVTHRERATIWVSQQTSMRIT